MRIIRHPKKKKLKGCVAALGTFDGVHLGHQKVIKSAVNYANKSGAASLVITFDPHPQQQIVPERGLKLLTTLKEREELFCGLGVDGVVVFRFNKKLQDLSYEKFIRKYLVDRLGVRKVFVGFDYAFGKGRLGDVSLLRRLGRKYGFEVGVIPPVVAGLRPIKSSRIRELVSRGEFARAVKLLGHPYQISGRVVKGSGRGAGLGFPTANLKLDRHKLIPAHGVYAGLVGSKKCAVNIGARPTFGAEQTRVEVHVLGAKQNLRGKPLKIVLTARLREEKQFADVAELKEQIRRDIYRIKML
ncbi:MAG: bifunctional riboflavin kinase/FAD synthetase [Candidatus Margulisbacteria bacterium]|nr:bifunctional riboflavin kinase/FAD synthetase [Candidatus Margulisiibacteriota bacterium]